MVEDPHQPVAEFGPDTPFLLELQELFCRHHPISEHEVAQAVTLLGRMPRAWTFADMNRRYGAFARMVTAFTDLEPDDLVRLEEDFAAMPYREFLASEYWKTVRDYVVQMRPACQMCNDGTAQHVHHRTYDHRGHEWRFLDDLVALCATCHARHHGKTAVR